MNNENGFAEYLKKVGLFDVLALFYAVGYVSAVGVILEVFLILTIDEVDIRVNTMVLNIFPMYLTIVANFAHNNYWTFCVSFSIVIIIAVVAQISALHVLLSVPFIFIAIGIRRLASWTVSQRFS